jgi:hypothetical protein
LSLAKIWGSAVRCVVNGGIWLIERSFYLCGMFFKTNNRYNVKTGKLENYYSLVESYRNKLGEPSHRTILSLGYDVDNTLPFREISDRLNELVTGQLNLFPLEEKAEKYTWQLYHQLIKDKKIDVLKQVRRKSKDSG